MVLKVEDITDILSGQKSDPRFAANKEYDGHEQIIYAEDTDIDFKAFVAVHNTVRGQALGGCRYSLSYENEDEAITDVLRLSKGMTYKNSLAKLDLGGGKAVIFGQAGHRKPTPEMMQALGKAVETLKGKYVTAEDMNTSENDMMIIWNETKNVTGIPLEKVASHLFPSGFDPKDLPEANPSPYTAYGNLYGLMAAVKFKMGLDNLKGVKVAVKGAAGAVGSELCRLLHERGAELVVADMDLNENTPEKLVEVAKRAQARLQELAAKFDAEVVSSDEIMEVEADVYAPCARGADIDDVSARTLKAKIIAGCANNVLAEPYHADLLKQRGILYAPDYAINAGGVICAGMQHLWHANPDKYPVPTDKGILERVEHIYDVLMEIFERAEAEDKNTAIVADIISEEGFQEKKTLSAAA